MIKFIKNLLCKHSDLKFIRNIGGDQQMQLYVRGGGLAKSEWVCQDCMATVYKSHRLE